MSGAVVGPLLRLARAGFVLAREGVLRAMAPPDPPTVGRIVLAVSALIERRGLTGVDRGTRVSEALNRLGPSYVKLGQFLATRPDVVGRDMAKDLEALQDRVASFPLADSIATIERALQRPWQAAFVSIGPPVAAASIAQVHKARVRTPDGETREVAVKVLRPGVEARFRRDLDSFYLAARLIEWLVPAVRRLRPVAVVDTLARSVRLEMDLRLEAAALSEMAENSRNDPGFRVPGVDWERTAKPVLTLEWVDGVKVSNLAGIEAAGHDRVALSKTVMQSFLRHAMRDGFFHADMHQGNLFVDADGLLVAVDFGITGRLNPAERRFLAEILFGFIRRDYLRTAEVHFEAGYVPPEQEVEVFAQALRAIGEPLRDRPAREISMAHLLNQLFEYTEVFDMKTQPRLILLQKTMVVVEGVARTLDPDLDIWTASEPVVREWIERNLGPGAKLGELAGSAGAVGGLVMRLPALAERVETVSAGLADMTRHGFRLDEETARAIGREEGRGRRLPTWIGALALAAIALKLLFG
ncbi:2-polyprenylphenol hydroxylase [Prosthecomicrobium hirschii]|uniref:2-polyprenylphenol hydroxylase n=1 Tax=Prosthecodimorpha hirschii TaxID=665126 RepID=A0A0P6VKS1_9HYPH|nr:2-polyprenylphenol 6-hydroxylase [Prosthecomicrobium hirschii]KPL52597.1 2-polyprenylphenol hydroxylase [Prosthecomicrobium hirschii]